MPEKEITIQRDRNSMISSNFKPIGDREALGIRFMDGRWLQGTNQSGVNVTIQNGYVTEQANTPGG
jgi:hypothetical protein